MNGPDRKPATAIVRWRGVPYELNLAAMRRALVRRQIEGELESMADLARLAGVSRSTATRLFSCKPRFPIQLGTALRIFRILRVEFDEVARLVDDETGARG